MANFILLCIHVIFVLAFIDLANTAVLPINNKEKEQVNFTNNSNNSDKNEQYVDTTRCIYDHDWLKHGNRMQMNNSCSYQQRSKTTALLISIYSGIFGADWFYLSRGRSGYIVVGICKLIISCGCCSGWPLLMLGAHRLSDIIITIGYIISMLFSLISLAWWIIDWTRILANKFPDGNGIELKHFYEYF